MKVKTFLMGLLIPLLLTALVLIYMQITQKPAPATVVQHQSDVLENMKPSEVDITNTGAESLEAYYQFVIDNNIFRPLGWKPTKKPPNYSLIGTAVSENREESKAFIVDRHTNQMHTVKVDDTIGEALVKVIEAKRVILNAAGKEIVLHGGNMQFFTRFR